MGVSGALGARLGGIAQRAAAAPVRPCSGVACLFRLRAGASAGEARQWLPVAPPRTSLRLLGTVAALNDAREALPLASAEQQALVDALKEGFNVAVDAVAGSGKTTAVLHAASAMPSERLLVVTYNAQLRLATQERARRLGLPNLMVHTYHSVARFVYGRLCRDNSEMAALLRPGVRPERRLAFDAIFIDEAQDMAPLYYKLIHQLLAINHIPNPRIAVIGDRFQAIYQFDPFNADPRYLTLAPQLYPSNSRPWRRLELRTSYRVTRTAAAFVNDVLLGHPRLRTAAGRGHGAPVVYLQGNAWRSAEYVAAELLAALRTGRLAPEDIFVVQFSMAARRQGVPAPIHLLQDRLSKARVPCWAATSDQEGLREEVIAGKAVFSTMHQTKGLERAAVVVFGFHAGLLDFYMKDAERSVCPELLYVATTRALRQLYLVAEEKVGGHLPFLSLAALRRLELPVAEAEGRGGEGRPPYVERLEFDFNMPKAERPEFHSFSRVAVTDLVKWLSEEDLEAAASLLTVSLVQGPSPSALSMPPTVPGVKGMESVSDITGVALPAMFQYNTTGNCAIADDIARTGGDTSFAVAAACCEEVKPIIARMQRGDELAPEDFTQLAGVYSMLQTKFSARQIQVASWSWIPPAAAKRCLANLSRYITHPDKARFEVPLDVFCHEGDGGINVPVNTRGLELSGMMDILTQNAVWEVKCVDSLKPEHVLQLALYAWMWENCAEGKQKHGMRHYYLINIRTGEVRELHDYGIAAVTSLLIDSYYRHDKTTSDDQFLQQCHDAVAKVADRHSDSSARSEGVVGGGHRRQGQPRRAQARHVAKMPFKCELCSPKRSFKTEGSLRKHKRTVHVGTPK